MIIKTTSSLAPLAGNSIKMFETDWIILTSSCLNGKIRYLPPYSETMPAISTASPCLIFGLLMPVKSRIMTVISPLPWITKVSPDVEMTVPRVITYWPSRASRISSILTGLGFSGAVWPVTAILSILIRRSEDAPDNLPLTVTISPLFSSGNFLSYL